jgi:hypothetical protein
MSRSEYEAAITEFLCSKGVTRFPPLALRQQLAPLLMLIEPRYAATRMPARPRVYRSFEVLWSAYH